MGRFADASEISDLIRRGHEVAGHTFDHLDCHRTPEADLTFDLDANDAALRGLGAAPIHFAYPYGEVSPRAKALLAGRDPASVVHQCGSGVSAVPNLIAMEVAGFAPTTLFAGSWSQWCSDPSRPCAQGA